MQVLDGIRLHAPAPLPGYHTDEVLAEVLGNTHKKNDRMDRAGIYE
jgi:hypothetical protein